MNKLTAWEHAFLVNQRVARLATVDPSGHPHTVPICYCYDGQNLFTPIDHKPKRVPIHRLKRLRNISANPKVSLVIDEYHDDWSQLCHLIIHAEAEIIEHDAEYRPEYRHALQLLTEKYPQYRQAKLAELGLPVIKIVPTKFISWQANPRSANPAS